MLDVARQPVPAPRFAWRTVGAGLVILALVLALIAAYIVGSHPSLPKPFGPARNGLVAYSSGGDIQTVDPVTGQSTAIVMGPDSDINPRWSRDGTELAFERITGFSPNTGLIYVARADGSGLTKVTPTPVFGITGYEFSPDGKALLISALVKEAPGLMIAATDGSGVRPLDLRTPAINASWRPSGGGEILYMDNEAEGEGGLVVVNVDTGITRTIIPGTPQGPLRGHAQWSPDGSLISFGQWSGLEGVIDVQVHIMGADATGDRVLPRPSGVLWQAPESWSNDGTRLLAVRGNTSDGSLPRLVAIPVDGSGAGVEVEDSLAIANGDPLDWEWAPDDKSILGAPMLGSGTPDQVLLDPVAGTFRTLPWTSLSLPSWQRLAP